MLPNANYYYHCRKYLHAVLKSNKRKILTKNVLKKSNSFLFINGRVLVNDSLIKKLTTQKTDKIFYDKDTLIAAYITKDNLSNISLEDEFEITNKKIKKMKIKQDVINYLWDIIELNAKEITKEAKQDFKLGKNYGQLYKNVTLVNKKGIFIAKGSKIKSGTVLDAESGPIIIEKNTTIAPNCSIIGPVYIGTNVTINPGAKILSATSIGEESKIGGEVAKTVFHSNSNKQHDGFIGRSYIGSWCNLGANTNNSDLKNNYSPVEIIINGKKVNTGLQFAGLFMGDHSKSGINTMFNTGTVVGTASNVFGAGYMPKFIPSFTWFDSTKIPKRYNFDKFLQTAVVVYKRRSKKFKQSDKKIFKVIHNITSKINTI